MLCCLNPDCLNPLNSDGNEQCQSCSTPLIPLLRGHYRVIKVLSDEGGFGKTYLAEDVDKLNEWCVVKQLAPKVQEKAALKKAVELFKEEAKRLQQLGEHDQIPTLFAYFEQHNYLFLVQQYIDGQNLLKEVQEKGIYSEREIQQLLLDLLPILQFIHERGVIHRDIKPQNIIRRKSDGRLVLIDFGASKQLTETVVNTTKIGTTIGSHGYTPIEQMEDGRAHPASDLFGLGATCFFLLTGISPSKLWLQHGYSWVAFWQKYLSSPGSGRVASRLKLGKVLDKLLKVEVQKRYQSAQEVLEDLSHFSPPPPETIITEPSGELRRFLLRPTDRNRKKYLLVTATSVLLGLGGIWYLSSQPFTVTQSSDIDVSQPVNRTSEDSSLATTLKGHSSDVNSVAFSPNGEILASASDDNTIKLWNVATKQEIRTLKGHSQWIWTVAFSPDGKTLASSGKDKTIKIWNLETGEVIHTLEGHSQGVTSVAFSPDGTTLASGSLDKTIKLWDWQTAKEIRTLKGHLGEVTSVAFSPNPPNLYTKGLRGILASGSWDKTIKLWNLSTGREIRTLKGHKHIILSVAFSPDSSTLASGSQDKTIKVWNLLTGEVIHTLKNHSDRVNSIAFMLNTESSNTANQWTLASGSSDNTIKLWNLATGEELRTLKQDSGYIYSVAISSNGQNLASGGSADNIVKIWQMSR